MTSQNAKLPLTSKLSTRAHTRLAVMTAMLACFLGFAAVLNAEDAQFVPHFSERIHNADSRRAYPPVSFKAPTPVYNSVASAGLIINPTFNANVDQATRDTINNVINFYESVITTNITVNIEFHNMNSGLGSSLSVVYTGPYSSYRTALGDVSFSADDMTALANTPA